MCLLLRPTSVSTWTFSCILACSPLQELGLQSSVQKEEVLAATLPLRNATRSSSPHGVQRCTKMHSQFSEVVLPMLCMFGMLLVLPVFPHYAQESCFLQFPFAKWLCQRAGMSNLGKQMDKRRLTMISLVNFYSHLKQLWLQGKVNSIMWGKEVKIKEKMTQAVLMLEHMAVMQDWWLMAHKA